MQMNMEVDIFTDEFFQCLEPALQEERRCHADELPNSSSFAFPEVDQAADDLINIMIEQPCVQIFPVPQGADVPSDRAYSYESQSSPSSSDCWSPINSESFYNDESIAEACKNEKINSSAWPTRIKEISTQEEPDTMSVFASTFYEMRLNTSPKTEAKPLFRHGALPKSAPKKPKKRASSIQSRVTVSQSFISEPKVQVDESGWRYFLRTDAKTIATNVLARQVKISRAGRKSEGKTTTRSAYTRMHDALNKAGWKRQIMGDFYYYQLPL